MMLSRIHPTLRLPSVHSFVAVPVFTIGAALVSLSGCGSSTEAPASVAGKTVVPAAPSATGHDVSEATNVVAQFLDAVRRGGETSGANQLLTQNAQAVLQRLGRTVQPIGSPDAVFTVTRAESVPEAPGAALVHSMWTEPVGDGKTESYQVVWALEDETAGWRISGLAMDLEPGKEPMIVDFENVTQMANLLNSNEESTAAAPGPSDAVSQLPTTEQPVQR